ncbi:MULTISPECIES: RHS repeat-associated core domain-containing protein [unclassified Paenibacillus]|uniref:RHS repeat-associated core domain-containing protein n=1 Tax=unclassified Paenibacillus TaxID=185978 RepID=UPI0009A7A79B|nr:MULTISPECIES: RHS repeat-associated core domain-containing protein [unclassified Paenibacillus]SLK14730.1 RHS repeat-associated core domain-containing protein [Paenibacillus sp. RU5A]SOC73623.1 RHS repeat-associated core domain-containing protein [Paenibacillus sp. RU26A]SOC75798.1 RHS repeat-associated core domain-containing protein [Paenibacillus sp. RU5M]
MKKGLSILLIFSFLASMLFPPEPGIQRAVASPSYDTPDTVSVTEDVYGNASLNPALGSAVDSNDLITITTISERFQVERDWIVLELGKGYALNEIYQALLAQEQGGSYETYIQEKYPDTMNHSLTVSPESVTFENEPGSLGRVDEPSVTEATYNDEYVSPSVTDEVYASPHSFALAANGYDDIALQRQSIKFDQAPYGVGSVNDSISTSDGSLNISVVDLVMPGANGLDFTLRRKYDSSLGKDQIGARVNPDFKNTTESTTEEQKFPIGKGWTWDLPYVKHEGGGTYVHIPGMGTFARPETGGLAGYPWENLDFGLVHSDLYVSGEKAYYVLTDYNTGIVQYFDQAGNILQIRNQYNNTIEFYYTTNFNYGTVLSFVMSRAGKGQPVQTMDFSYSTNQVKVSFDDRVVTYKTRNVTSNNRTQRLLDHVIDAEGRITKYGYLRWNGLLFNLIDFYKDYTGENQQVYWGWNDWLVLASIEHPTKAMTQYTFGGTVLRKLGPTGAETQPRYGQRRVYYSTAGQEVSNQINVSYSGDIGAIYGQNNTFTTTVEDGLTRSEYSFKKQFVAHNKPDVVYNTQISTRAIEGNQRRVTAYTYNEAAYRNVPTRIEERSYDTAGASSAAVTSLQYNDWGQVIARTNQLGATIKSTYEMKFFSGYDLSPLIALTQSTETGGSSQQATTNYSYDSVTGSLTQSVIRDSQGNLLGQTNYQYDGYGNPIVLQLKGETADTIVRQEFGYKSMLPTRQEAQVTDAAGKSSTVTVQAGYNATGEMNSYKDGNQNTTTTTYDKLGRVISEKNPDGSMTTLSYDDVNNTLTVKTPDLSQTVYRFDSLGRLSSETNERGSKTYTYDVYDRMIAQTDATGQTTTYVYDAFNRVIRQQDGTSTTQMAYDDAARTLTITDGENNRIRETHNVMGQVTKKEELKASGNVALATYTYDSVGNVISITDGNGNLTTNGYDALSRLTSVTDAENKKTSYTYNLGGDLTKVTYADGKTVQKRYDEIGRLLVQTDPLGQVTTYTYDANDNVTKVLDRKGQERTYVYNNRNFLLENRASDGTISYTYDAMGRRTGMGDATGSTQYVYTPVGELERITYPDGATLTLGYDARGVRTRQIFQQGSYTLNLGMSYKGASALPATLSLTNGSGTALGSFAYTYRGNNNLAQKSAGSGWKEVYTYDGLNLKGLTHTFQGTNGPSYSYAYDNNRNMTSKTDQGIASQFTYDKLNRIKTSSPYQETYTYDVRDNRSSLESDREWNPPVPASYSYDARNQLTGATVNAQTVSYRYNGDGLMTERSTGGQTTRYYYDNRGLLVAEGTVGSTGAVQITVGYVYDATGKLTARQIAGANQLQSYVTNGHGDVTEVRDASGNVLNRYTYDIWGNPETTEETVPNVLRYAGEYWDEVTGLQYLRARWYDPSTARFINEDTVEGELTNPLSLHLYTYVENNPLIYVDSSGYGKRPANNTIEGMGLGSGSASGGRMTPGGSMGGGGSKGGSGTSGSKPSTSGKVSGSLNGLSNAEKKVVNDLINSGKNVEIIPKDPYSKVKTPDFKVNGIKTELKTLENANINTGITRIQKGLKQGADTVIIDARAAGLTVDQAKEIIKRASGTYSNKTIPGKVEIWTNEGNITYP